MASHRFQCQILLVSWHSSHSPVARIIIHDVRPGLAWKSCLGAHTEASLPFFICHITLGVGWRGSVFISSWSRRLQDGCSRDR